jgi:O-antigen/teichoic acid export membrane protein
MHQRLDRHRASTLDRTRKGLVTIADQVVSSASNILILMAIARLTSPSDFGLIALELTVVYTALAITRQALGTPLMLTSADGVVRVEFAAERSLSVCLLFGAALSGGILACGFIWGRPDLAAPVALAAPFVLSQDLYRFAAMCLHRSSFALLWDAVWAVISFVILAGTWAGVEWLTGVSAVYVWSFCALTCSVGLGAMMRLRPRVFGLLTWWRHKLHHRVRFGSEAAIGSLTVLAVSGIATLLLGPVATGALRGAGVVVGPLNILMSAIPLIILPGAVRSIDTLPRVWRHLWPFAAILSLLAVIVALTGYLLPTAIGHLFLGKTWDNVRPLLPFTGLEYLALAWLSCNKTALQAMEMSRELLRLRVMFAAISVALSAAAALLFGTARSMSAALAVSAVLMLVPSWVIARRKAEAL